ncbi:MAG: LuxR family transcriptional regulator [Rhodovulum sulfidophilum]|uniref:LuxR family transcriptional regulator n=1 Tax=Rhodovulum sulfidophilum TaxID=35806 RepID=A0A2W5NGN5_RHOSU|nr:MAG: LuxR family transcriptional regulator [Rhodovulum sulfidophilum]
MQRYIDDFQALAPAGFYLAIRVGFAFPMVEHNQFPAGWVREYTTSGLMVRDPAMAWVYRNDGAARWSDLEAEDRAGVLTLAKGHGLMFGAAVGCRDSAGAGGQRSFGLFCRADREFDSAELARLRTLLLEAHREHDRPRNLTAAELETLGMVKNGLLMKEIAGMLGVSESAVKQRLKNARLKLRAKTGSQAAAKATMLGMI